MDQATHNKIVSFIWGIADDVQRDLFTCGKYPDVILPMCVIRRMDAVLERNKQRPASPSSAPPCATLRGMPSTTPRNSRCATSSREAASSSSWASAATCRRIVRVLSVYPLTV
jgi:hypothetical protein